MNSIKKYIAIILSFVLVLGIVDKGVFAEETEPTETPSEEIVCEESQTLTEGVCVDNPVIEEEPLEDVIEEETTGEEIEEVEITTQPSFLQMATDALNNKDAIIDAATNYYNNQTPENYDYLISLFDYQTIIELSNSLSDEEKNNDEVKAIREPIGMLILQVINIIDPMVYSEPEVTTYGFPMLMSASADMETFLTNFETLCDLATTYVAGAEDTSTYDGGKSSWEPFNYLRLLAYPAGGLWDTLCGRDDAFVTYVAAQNPTLDTYFRGIDVIDEIDIKHMAAGIATNLYKSGFIIDTMDSFMSWAGDLGTLTAEVVTAAGPSASQETYKDTTINMMGQAGTTFNTPDFNADVDAKNIAAIIAGGTSAKETLNKYYDTDAATNVAKRVTNFIGSDTEASIASDAANKVGLYGALQAGTTYTADQKNGVGEGYAKYLFEQKDAETVTVTSVTVNPTSANINVGNSLSFSAQVLGQNNPSQNVTWQITGAASTTTTVDTNGLVTIGTDETANTITLRATSTFDTTKFADIIITIVRPTPTPTPTPTPIATPIATPVVNNNNDSKNLVTYLDCSGNTVKIEWVEYGGSSSAPSNQFTSVSNVTADLIVKPNNCTVTNGYKIPNTSDKN